MPKRPSNSASDPQNQLNPQVQGPAGLFGGPLPTWFLKGSYIAKCSMVQGLFKVGLWFRKFGLFRCSRPMIRTQAKRNRNPVNRTSLGCKAQGLKV